MAGAGPSQQSPVKLPSPLTGQVFNHLFYRLWKETRPRETRPSEVERMPCR